MVGAVACGDSAKTLTLWGPTEQQDTLRTMADKFLEENPDLDIKIEIGVCSEGDAHANVSKDPSAAADVYAFANDQIVNLVRVGGLAEIGGSYKTAIEQNNGEGAVKAGQFNGKQYGYPYSADNGYFLYYDKSVITDEDAGTLEAILQKCETNNKTIGWAIDDSWYVAGWFFTFGGSYNVVYNDDGTEKTVTCTFNDSVNGIKAAKAMAKLANSTAFAGAGTSNDTITAGIGTTMAAAVTGTWNAEAIQAKLGDNYGVAKLPTVTVDGDTKQLSSFAGYKLYGVNPHADTKGVLTEAHMLAAYLSGEAMQQLRFENHKIGPSNTKVAASEAVQANKALAALSAQNAFAVAQTAVPANFWDPVKAFGLAIMDGLAETEYQAKLDTMVGQIVPKIVFDDASAEVYLIGNAVNNWGPDASKLVKFTKSDDGKTWTLEHTFTALPKNEKDEDVSIAVKAIKFDKNGTEKWSDADNTILEEVGTYTFTYNMETDTLTAVKKA